MTVTKADGDLRIEPAGPARRVTFRYSLPGDGGLYLLEPVGRNVYALPAYARPALARCLQSGRPAVFAVRADLADGTVDELAGADLATAISRPGTSAVAGPRSPRP